MRLDPGWISYYEIDGWILFTVAAPLWYLQQLYANTMLRCYRVSSVQFCRYPQSNTSAITGNVSVYINDTIRYR